jgi:ribonuclease BN (tRNA processing enzyme)
VQLLVLGSGTAIPHPARGAAGLALRLPEGVLLLDTGPGSSRRWPAVGIRGDEVRWIASTHYHADHLGDLAAILFGFEVPAAAAPAALTLVGPPGHRELLARLESVYPGLSAKRVQRDVREIAIDGSALDLGAFVLRARQAGHKQPAVSYRVEVGRRSLVYSGDTDQVDSLVELCQGADVALLDCSMPDGEGTPGHMTPSECADVAARARVGMLVLTHLYPACDGIDVAVQAGAGFGGEIRVAHDGMRIDL